MHDAFISYSSKDVSIANAVCAELENQGIRCWIAPRDVVASTSWGGQITRAIRESKVFILLFSEHSNASQDVLNEVALAAEKRLHIINLRLEELPLNDTLHYHLRARHWLDALTPPLTEHIRKLGTAVLHLLELDGRQLSPTRVIETLEQNNAGKSLVAEPELTTSIIAEPIKEESVANYVIAEKSIEARDSPIQQEATRSATSVEVQPLAYKSIFKDSLTGESSETGSKILRMNFSALLAVISKSFRIYTSKNSPLGRKIVDGAALLCIVLLFFASIAKQNDGLSIVQCIILVIWLVLFFVRKKLVKEAPLTASDLKDSNQPVQVDDTSCLWRWLSFLQRVHPWLSGIIIRFLYVVCLLLEVVAIVLGIAWIVQLPYGYGYTSDPYYLRYLIWGIIGSSLATASFVFLAAKLRQQLKALRFLRKRTQGGTPAGE